MRDYDRGQDVAAKMSLAEHANALQAKLEEKKQAWASGERAAAQEFTSSENKLGREAAAGLQTERIAADAARQRASDEAALRRTQISEGGANARAAMADSIARQKLAIDQKAADLAAENALPKDVILQYQTLDARMKGVEAEAQKVIGSQTASEAEKAAARSAAGRRIEELLQQQEGLLGTVRTRKTESEPNIRGRGALGGGTASNGVVMPKFVKQDF
jgi:hypothetical protein